MKKLLIFFILIIALFGCDKRGIDKPEMVVTTDKTEIYNSQNDRTIILTYKLSGEKSYIANEKVLVEYDSDLGTLIGTGNAHYLFTDENGEAEAIFQISSAATGTVEITSRMDDFRTVDFTNNIVVHFKPTIESFVATPDTIAANGTSMSVLDLQLGNTDKLDGVKIMFSSTYGTLTNDSTYTDGRGHAQISILSSNSPAHAIIYAHLERCPEVTASVDVWME